jgi:hypothetical protein
VYGPKKLKGMEKKRMNETIRFLMKAVLALAWMFYAYTLKTNGSDIMAGIMTITAAIFIMSLLFQGGPSRG